MKNPKETLCNLFLNGLLHPKDWQEYGPPGRFSFKKHHIIELIAEC